MTHYLSNLRDLEFNLFEVLALGSRLGRAPFEEFDETTIRDLLAQASELATGPVADSWVDGDRNPPVYDPATCSVTMPEAFRKAYEAYLDAELWRLDLPVEAGGFSAPRSLWWSVIELIQGANAPVYMFGSGPGFGGLLYRLGTEEQKQIGARMIERRWAGTMVLTEPDAGSDVGAGRTKANRQPDGTWHLHGVKRFITSGEHDLSDNIVHFVLARPEGASPGTKGLSLFVVPKFHFDWATGELGERNGVYATNVEKKMGLKVSTTCELTFGDPQLGGPAVGWLLGEVHDGIAQMFRVIESARMQVGVKSIATLSTGYLNALDYARTRVQGADLAAADKTAPRVRIDQHPDVRRMLMLQKSYAEGLRALYLYAADQLDHGRDPDIAQGMNDLLLPLVKAVGSERSWEMLTLSLQTLGGSGFLQDYPFEHYLRDVKIDTLYEGTTGIQGMDFFFRKIARDRGAVLERLTTEIDGFVDRADERLATEAGQVRSALGDVRAMVARMLEWDDASKECAEKVYLVGQNTTRLLMSVGDLMVGYLLLRQAGVALVALDRGSRESDFYEGKLAAARFFTATVLPEITARLTVMEQTDQSLMQVRAEAF